MPRQLLDLLEEVLLAIMKLLDLTSLQCSTPDHKSMPNVAGISLDVCRPVSSGWRSGCLTVNRNGRADEKEFLNIHSAARKKQR